MALAAEHTRMKKYRQRSNAAGGAALAAAVALVLACIVVAVATSQDRNGHDAAPHVELVQGGPGDARKEAKICFGKVCAFTSAAFAKVLEGTEKTIFAEGEKRGIRKVEEEAESHAEKFATAHQRLSHLHAVLRDRARQEREEYAREEAGSLDRSSNRSKPKWQSEWRSIFGTRG